MIDSDPLLQLSCAVLVLLVPTGLSRVLPRVQRSGRAAIIAGALGGAGSLLANVMVSASNDVAANVFNASAAGAFAASFALLVASWFGARASTFIAVLWSVLVYQPVFWATVSVVPSLMESVFGAVDFAAVLATHVSAATVFGVIAWTRRSSVVADAGEALFDPVSWRRGALAAVLVTAGASAWMLGLERVLSQSSGRIALNASGGLALGAVVWLLVSHIAGRPSGPRGMVAGAVVAWGGIGGGVAFLSPSALIASVVLGTAAGAALVARAKEESNRVRRCALSVVIAVMVGGTVLAILADGFGMAATGSVSLVAGQLGAVIAVVAYAGASALAVRLVASAGRTARLRSAGGRAP